MSNTDDAVVPLDDGSGIDLQSGEKNVTAFTIVNTNARSLCPKIHSLIDCFNELEADIAIITETWLTSGDSD